MDGVSSMPGPPYQRAGPINIWGYFFRTGEAFEKYFSKFWCTSPPRFANDYEPVQVDNRQPIFSINSMKASDTSFSKRYNFGKMPQRTRSVCSYLYGYIMASLVLFRSARNKMVFTSNFYITIMYLLNLQEVTGRCPVWSVRESRYKQNLCVDPPPLVLSLLWFPVPSFPMNF